jgi:dihydroxy-acid dehydratase
MNTSGIEGVERNLATYGDREFSRYLRRAFLASAGYDPDDLSRPLIGIADTSSDYTPCHRQMPELIAAARRGVLQAGGLPMVFPTISLGETLLSPTSMLYRNLMAMETEELVRSQPMDAVVLVGGCDKTVPAQMMAAVSANVPAILLVAGPMLTGRWRGARLGACSDCRRYWAEFRAGNLDEHEIRELEQALCPTAGTCMVMGTASTMACIAEFLGMMLPGGATAPAASGDRLRHAVQTGRHAVQIARMQLTPRSFLDRSFRNAVVGLAAIGGSTNAVIHLLAIARRAGVPLELDDFDRAAREVPVLVDCKPTGAGYMEDFHQAGGVPVLLRTLEPFLDKEAKGVDTLSVADRIRATAVPTFEQSMIRSLDDPVSGTEALVVLRGSLAPDGAVLKASAASPELLRHRGPALVFDSPEDASTRLANPNLKATADHVLVLKNAGPIGAGMPEAGSLPIPKGLAAAGVRDMVRISDARMSGTAYGTVVLHCSPEAAAGGPLALVRDGDEIELNVPERRLELHVPESELARRAESAAPWKVAERGWRHLFDKHVLPAHLGADLDFL